MSDILSWKTVATRKPHRCFGCAEEYPAQFQMVRASYADGGTVYGCYWCPICEEYMRRYFKSGDETGYSEIKYGDRESWEVLRQELAAKSSNPPQMI